MAFKKRRTFKKRRNTDHKKIMKIQKTLRVIKPEMKYMDVSSSGTVTLSSTTVDLTALISQGLLDNANRVGDKIRLCSYELRYVVFSDNTSTFRYTNVRVMVVVGNNENSTALNMANVLQSTGAALSYLSPYNHDTRTKFIKKYDKTNLLNSGTTGGWQTTKLNRVSQKLSNFTQYVSGSTTVSNHGLYLMFISDTTSTPPTIAYYLRLNYLDA